MKDKGQQIWIVMVRQKVKCCNKNTEDTVIGLTSTKTKALKHIHIPLNKAEGEDKNWFFVLLDARLDQDMMGYANTLEFYSRHGKLLKKQPF